MSDNKKQPFWHELIANLPSENPEHIRAIAGHTLDPIFQTRITPYGTVHITVHNALKQGRSWIPSAFEHTLNHQNEPFSRDFYGPDGGEKQALTFWLTPDAMHGDVQKKLDDFAAALRAKHGIEPLEAKYFVPDAEIIEQFGQPVGCGVVLATTAENTEKLTTIKATIARERTAAEVLRAASPPQPLLLSHHAKPKPGVWETRFNGNTHARQRARVARYDVLEHAAPYPFWVAEIHADGTASMELPPEFGSAWGEGNHPIDLTLGSDVLKNLPPEYHHTQGIAIWVDPSFYSEARDSMEQWAEVALRLTPLLRGLQQRHKIKLIETLIPLESTFQNTEGRLGSVLVLMAPLSEQKKLLTNVYQDLLGAAERAKSADIMRANPLDARKSR